MIVSAISLFKKFNLTASLGSTEWGIEQKEGRRYSHVSFSGHASADGGVRIYARYARQVGSDVRPAILLLPDAGKGIDTELMDYFVDKGYAVLTADYCGKTTEDGEGEGMHTVYPPSLSHGNLISARGLYDMKGLAAEQTTWFEWTYVALYAIRYLKERKDVSNIGIVGVRTGGELAWHAMLDENVKCAIPINAVGWHSFLHLAKFGDNISHNLSDDTHRYIAAVEAQSYAPYAKCPVLMLCSLRDRIFDCDRAYDTYSRIGGKEDNALAYSIQSGACIGPYGLVDMDLFLEKNLKGREIYIPDTLNVSLKEVSEGIEVTVDCDKEGILEEAGVYYAEADVKIPAAFREWRCVYTVDGRTVKDGKARYVVKPFAGAKAVFVFAYAKYINGFRVMSKIVSKRLSNAQSNDVKSRMLFSGAEMDCFCVADHKAYSIGDIFLEREAVPKVVKGYGDINGAYSVGGIKTYKISSPQYIPDENAMLKFDVYTKESQRLTVSVEVAGEYTERYNCTFEVRGGGKWKRILLKAADFKGESYGAPLQNFYDGSTLSFACADEEKEYAITNILWL